MTIFRAFRRLFAAIERLAYQIERVAQALEDAGPALRRLDELELSRHKFEAMMEGLYLKAEGKLKAASNAEARERQLKKSYEKHVIDALDLDSDARPEDETVLPVHAAPGEEKGVHALRLDVAPSGKAFAVRAKFGM